MGKKRWQENKTETVGDRLKYLRETYKFTQKQVADFLNFKQSQIVKLEKNQRKLKASSLEKLCNLYQCEEDYILYGEGKHTKPQFAFRSKNKNIDLHVMADMNKIIKNLEFLDAMSEYLDE